MNKVQHLLISFILLFSLVPVTAGFAEAENNAERLDTLISEAIYYFGENAHTDVERILTIINENYPEESEIWDSVFKQWYYIENEMPENIDVAPNGLPNDDTHAFIVLGFALKEDGTMEDELVGRLQVALDSAEKYPNSYILVTGGVEKNGWTEGDRMYEWLVDNGLSPDRIIVENNSSDTVENASFSYDYLYNDYDIRTASLISSQYHIKRGSIFYHTMSLLKAKELGKEAIEFLPDGNAGWYRSDKTEEPLDLKTRGMYSISGVSAPGELPISVLDSLNIIGDTEYELNEPLNIQVFAEYDTGYKKDVTPNINISGFSSSEPGEKEIEIMYEENGKELTETFTITVVDDEETVVDKTALEEVVAEVEALDEDLYTPATWEGLMDALAKADAILVDDEASQEDVNAAATVLEDALVQLEEVEEPSPDPEEVDKATLEKLVKKTGALSAADYTKATWDGLAVALADAEAVLAGEEASQEDVDAALAALETAIDGLEKAEKTPEKPEAGDDEKDEKDNDKQAGSSLPNTATNMYNWLIVGGIVLLLGLIVVVVSRKKK